MAQNAEIHRICRENLAAMLDIDEAAILASTTFSDLGLDSATAVHFILEVEQRWGIELYPGVTHDYPTVAEFASYVGAQLASHGASRTSATRRAI